MNLFLDYQKKIFNTLKNKINDVQIPKLVDGYKHVFHQYIIKVKNRDLLKNFLSERNIEQDQ